MARVLFIIFAGAFCLAACFPIKSASAESGWAEFTFAIAFQDYPSGIYYDRQFDWPSGEAIWIDVPAVAVDIGLLAGASVAFGCYAKKKLREQKAARL
jgi:hypothetical protein